MRTAEFYSAFIGRDLTPVERACIEECDRIADLKDARHKSWLAEQSPLENKLAGRVHTEGNTP